MKSCARPPPSPCFRSYDLWLHYRATMTPTEANTYKRSMLGFRYPFCNGSFDVSDKGLRNPNRPFNVLIRRTNKFGINMPITSTAQHIRRVKVANFVGRGGIALLGTTTLRIVILFFGSTLSLLHKSLLERRRSFVL